MSDTTGTEFEKFTTDEIAKLNLDITQLRAERDAEIHHKARIKAWGHLVILILGTVIAASILHDLTGVILGSLPAGGIEIFDRLAKII